MQFLGKIPIVINYKALLITLKVGSFVLLYFLSFFFFLLMTERWRTWLSQKKEMIRQACSEMREHPRDSFTSLCSLNPALKCNLVEVKTPERQRRGSAQTWKALRLL